MGSPLLIGSMLKPYCFYYNKGEVWWIMICGLHLKRSVKNGFSLSTIKFKQWTCNIFNRTYK